MKYCVLCCAAFFILLAAASAQDSTETDNSTDTKKWKLEPLLGYTFSNRGGWANVTPEIFLGFDTSIYTTPNQQQTIRFRFGPTIATTSAEIDSSSYFRTIMLPGPANLSLSMFHTYTCLHGKIQFINMLGTSLKMMGNNENNQSLTQNNIKASTGIAVLKLFQLTAEHTWAWHNITTEAEENFKSTFQTKSTNVRYLTLTLEGYSQAMDLFLVFSWRKFLSNSFYIENYAKDVKIVSLGVRKDLDLISQPPGR